MIKPQLKTAHGNSNVSTLFSWVLGNLRSNFENDLLKSNIDQISKKNLHKEIIVEA